MVSVGPNWALVDHIGTSAMNKAVVMKPQIYAIDLDLFLTSLSAQFGKSGTNAIQSRFAKNIGRGHFHTEYYWLHGLNLL